MELGLVGRVWSSHVTLIATANPRMRDFFYNAWNIAVDDPRKVVHGLKVGLALTVISFFYYLDPLYDDLESNAIWAVMTVVVVSEFTVGASLYKGFNRICATSLAGFVLVGLQWLASKSGHMGQTVILGIALFLVGSAATFSRFIPIIKTNFDYGVLIFILTYSMASVSAYRMDELAKFAQQRMYTVVCGCLCWTVIMFIRPVWAGSDLHRLVVANFQKLADSIEGCTGEFLGDLSSAADAQACTKSQCYKAVLDSKASEDSLANLAKWEPAHGSFGFRHPWQQYLDVTASLRHCAYCVEALLAGIHSDAEMSDITKEHLANPCMELSTQCSEVLRELSNTVKTLTKSSTVDLLVEEMNSAVLDLQDAIAKMPCLVAPPVPSVPQGEEATDQEGPKLPMPLLLASLPVANVASMLVEVASRVGGIVEAVDSLARVASFQPPSDDKPKQPEPSQGGGEDLKTLQIV